jgi:RecA-family ATPase
MNAPLLDISDDSVAALVRDAVRGIALAAGLVAKMQALRAGAVSFAIPVRHRLVDAHDVRDLLLEHAMNHDELARAGEGAVLKVIESGLNDVETATRKPAPAKHHAPLFLIDPTTWQGKPVPDQRWLAHERIPMGVPTLLTGDGGTGKTRIAMQLAVATVLGTDWLGSVIDQKGSAIFFTAEETAEQCHRLLDRITAYLEIRLDRLAGLHLYCADTSDPILAAPDSRGVVRPTDIFARLVTAVRDVRPALIVIDTAADAFAVNENDRAQARRCVALLRTLAMEGGGSAVVLIAHPSLSGLNSGRGTSGSTAWGNSVRSRLYFSHIKSHDDTWAHGDTRELRMMKSNYGPTGEAMRVRWHNGVFVPVGSLPSLDKLAAESVAEGVYLDCLDASVAQKRHVFPMQGKGYAPKVFADMPHARGLHWRTLENAQERLFAAGRIQAIPHGPASRSSRRIARKDTAE